MSTTTSITPTSDGAWGVSLSDSDLMRYPPEPRNSAGSWVNSAVGAVANVASSALGAGSFAASGDFSALLAQQLEVQRVMQVVSMQSNISRSQHETEMTPIRNMRVG